MTTAYPTVGRSLTPGDIHLSAVVHLLNREPYETGDDVARHYNMSPSHLYGLAARAREALTPRPPGPRPGSGRVATLEQTVTVQQQIIASQNICIRKLEAQLAAAMVVDDHRRDVLELVCFDHGVPLRGTQEIQKVAFGTSRSRQEIKDARHRHGETARFILNQVERKYGPKQTCLAGDDIYFHGHAVKVVAEPRSVAILGIGRWDGATGEDWGLWLAPYPNLQLFVSDLGGGLLSAAENAKIPHQADYFHENRWLDLHLLVPLGREADQAWAALEDAWERATRPDGRGRRLAPSQVWKAEEESSKTDQRFFQAVSLLERLDGLFQATEPGSHQLWTSERVTKTLEEVIAELQAMGGDAAKRTARHLKRYGHRYTAWHKMFDRIDVHTRDPSRHSREVLNELLHLWKLEEAMNGSGEHGDVEIVEVQRWITRLEHRLHRMCSNLEEVKVMLRRTLKYPQRSSSMVESLNSRLRVMQTTHRQVTDEMLALRALAWNLTPRRHANRRGHRSPYEMLGVDIGQGNRPWYEVLLEEERRKK